jgi:transcription antitermination factor NusG
MEKNWYVVHTYSGFEEKVKLSIEEKLKQGDLKERIRGKVEAGRLEGKDLPHPHSHRKSARDEGGEETGDGPEVLSWLYPYRDVS